MNTTTTWHHVVYWTIPQINAEGVVVSERHYAVNLAELEPEVASKIASLLNIEDPPEGQSEDDQDQRTARRTNPGITGYRHLFRPFIEVKKRTGDLCRFSSVWLPFFYAEYADAYQDEPQHHSHPSVRPLAGAG